MASSSTELSYATDENKANYIRVILAVKGLKTSKSLKSLFKQTKVPDNAEILDTFGNRNFSIKVNGTKDLKGKNFHLEIEQLPGDIDPVNSYYEVEKDRILLFLRKKEDKSWYPELNDGLETLE